MADTLYAFFLPVYSFSKRQVLYCKDCGLTTTIEKYSEYGMRDSTAQIRLSQQPHNAIETTCRRCGSPIGDKGWKFCPKCGNQIP